LLKRVVGSFRYTLLTLGIFGAPKPLETCTPFAVRGEPVMAKKAAKKSKKKGKKKSSKKR